MIYEPQSTLHPPLPIFNPKHNTKPFDHHTQIMGWIQTLPYQFDNVSSPGKGPGPK